MPVSEHIREALSNTKKLKKFRTCNFTFRNLKKKMVRKSGVNCYPDIDDILNGLIIWKRKYGNMKQNKVTYSCCIC